VIVQVPALHGVRGQVRIEQAHALAAAMALAGIGHAFRPGGAQLGAQGLAGPVVVGVERRTQGRIAAAQVVQRAPDVQHDLAELRGPARRLDRGGHEQGVVVEGLRQRDLETVGDIEHPERPGAEPAGPVGADMGERGHQVAGPRPGDPAVLGHQVQIADGLHQARIGLLLGGDQQRPVGGIGDVLEQVDRRPGAADDPHRAAPDDRCARDRGRVDHQAPRSASR
jgi:hypothetical protein